MIEHSTKTILSVNSLSKNFMNVQAIKNISFSLEQGDIFAFLGPNGAGKTTTLRILLDIIRADSGSINWKINGKERPQPQAEQIGYLPEERGLYTDIPVIRSLVYLASIRGMEPAKARNSAMKWLEKLELADRAKEKLQALSKGNQQKVQFVASILHEPTFAILDEPFSGLDPLNQEKFIGYIKELNDRGTTILLSSHQMPLVEKIARKVFLINQGKELYNGTLSGIFQNFGKQHILDIAFKEDISNEKMKLLTEAQSITQVNAQLVRVTFQQGTNLNNALAQLANIEGISSISSHKPDLHEIFLHLVKTHQA